MKPPVRLPHDAGESCIPGRAAEAFARSLTVGCGKRIGEDAALACQAAPAVMEGVTRGAVVFHCTAGKDRTGVLPAILLRCRA